MGARTTMTDDEKRAVVARIESGAATKKEVREEYGVSGNAVRLWCIKFAATAKSASGAKPKREPKAKATKKSKRKRAAPAAAEPTSTLLTAHHVNDEWSLPHPLGELVVCAEILRDVDDFDVLARLETAVAAHRDLMERRAAA